MRYCDKCGNQASQDCWRCHRDYCDDCALVSTIEYEAKDKFGKKDTVTIHVHDLCPFCDVKTK